MKFFIQTSNKSIVFLLFFTVWTDVILPMPYKNSNLAFWIWTMFIYCWYYFAFKHLYQISKANFKIKLLFNLSLIILIISTSLYWGFGINITISYFQSICYIYLATVITFFLLQKEKKEKINLDSILTFLLVFILPIGAWWIHKRIQNVVLRDSQGFEN